MKKLIAVLAICAVAGFAAADSTVVSANVVGYTTIQPYDAYGNIWGGQVFQPIGSGSTTLSNLMQNANLNYGDTIQVFDNASSLFVVYSWDGSFWEDTDLNRVGADIPDIAMPAGTGFFLNTTSTVLVAGQVISTNVTHSILQGYNLVSSAFPVPFNLDTADFSQLSYGDMIQIFDVGTKQFDVLSWDGTYWEDVNLNYVTGAITATGESFFIIPAANTTFVEPTPLK